MKKASPSKTAKAKKPTVKVQDLKAKKDAKGGRKAGEGQKDFP